MTKKLARTMLLLTALTAVATGCDRLTATVVGVSVLTSSPDMATAEGFPTSLASVFPTDPAFSGATAVAVGLGERESATSTSAPQPMGGASVTISFGGSTLEVCEADTGSYLATSIPGDCEQPSLDYLEDETYVTEIETSDDVHSVRITAPAAIPVSSISLSTDPCAVVNRYDPDSSNSFTSDTFCKHTRNQGMTVDWSSDSAASERNTFVTLLRFNFSGDGSAASFVDDTKWLADPGNPVFDNAPRDPGGMTDLVLETPATSADIPGSVFDTTGMYLLVVTNTELSTDSSSSLVLGSGALAGKGTAFFIWVN